MARLYLAVVGINGSAELHGTDTHAFCQLLISLIGFHLNQWSAIIFPSVSCSLMFYFVSGFLIFSPTFSLQFFPPVLFPVLFFSLGRSFVLSLLQSSQLRLCR